MLRIDCPWCSPRAELEFQWAGDAHVTRPEPSASDAEWARYLFQRRNPKGVALERWRHTFGCRQWFNLARDTVSHEILAVYRLGEAPPAHLAEPGA
jgi:heterotetrameric sarcosine oxidase delta subunit